jgi:hypothetical protein
MDVFHASREAPAIILNRWPEKAEKRTGDARAGYLNMLLSTFYIEGYLAHSLILKLS